MTREEAIERIKAALDMDDIEGHCYILTKDADRKAFYLAIKALEQQPSEDAVSREAAIEAVIDLCKYYTPTKSVNHPHMDFVIEELQNLPSVTPQQPCEDWYDVPSDEMTLEQAKQAVKDLRKKLSEYLEQQPCEDAVSREAVKEQMIKYGFLAPDMTVTEFVEDMPSVTPKTRWIPVSERLPKERAYYLITVKIDGMNGCKPYYEIQTSWYSDKQFVVEYRGDGLVARKSVVAWMPLPEPYKEESEDAG